MNLAYKNNALGVYVALKWRDMVENWTSLRAKGCRVVLLLLLQHPPGLNKNNNLIHDRLLMACWVDSPSS